jgi:hypothetical protein
MVDVAGMQKCQMHNDEKGHLQVPGGDGTTILKGVLKEQDGRMWTRCMWLSNGSSGGLS